MKRATFRIMQTGILLLFWQMTFASALSCLSTHATIGSWSPSISITNNCGTAVDLQNAILEFQSNENITGTYWGNFDNLAYPSDTTIYSEATSTGYLIKMPMIFPTGSDGWTPKTTIDSGATITITFSGTPSITISNMAVFVMSSTTQTSTITFTIPANPTTDTVTPVITVSDSSTGYSKVLNTLSWSSTYIMTGVPYGTYDIKVGTLTVGSQSWQGVAAPSSVSLTDSTGVNVSVSYQLMASVGQISMNLSQSAPESSLNTAVAMHVQDTTTGQNLPDVLLPWGQTTTMTGLNAGDNYKYSIDPLQGKDTIYYPVFSPADNATVVANSTQPLSVSFNGVAIQTQLISTSISGLPSGVQAQVTAVDNYNYQYVTNVQDTSTALWSLPVSRQYQVSANTVTSNGVTYVPTVTPSSFLLVSGQSQSVTITYQQQVNMTRISPYVDISLSTITKWDSTTQTMQPLGLLDIANNSGLKALTLAFVTAQNGCAGTWAGYPVSSSSTGYAVPVIKQLQSQGVSITISMGGMAGQYLAQGCTTVDTLTAAYEQVITAYNPDMLDFDVENNMQTDNTSLDRMMQALKNIEANHPNINISFTLPVMPTGLVSGVGENVIDRAAANGLSDYLVNIMAMDYGGSFTAKTMGQYAIDAANATFNQLKALYPNQSDQTLWHRMAVTPMIGLNDTRPLNFSLNDVSTLTAFAKLNELGLLAFWSVTRDHSCNSTSVSVSCSSNDPSTGLPNQQSDYQYSKAFMN